MKATAERPQAGEFSAYYQKYIDLVPDGDVLNSLERQLQDSGYLLKSISPDHALFRYDAGKWSVKEVLGHLIDAERIFTYRALRISRGDQTPLPGWEQDDYIRDTNFDARNVASLAIEFENVRRSTLSLYRNLEERAWDRRGIANNVEVSVRALAWITAGHELHHRNVLKEKYGLGI
jgi:uncharacterized damage-inducible protein DinB